MSFSDFKRIFYIYILLLKIELIRNAHVVDYHSECLKKINK